MFKKTIAFILMACMTLSLWFVPVQAGEKPRTESSQESAAEPSSIEESQGFAEESSVPVEESSETFQEESSVSAEESMEASQEEISASAEESSVEETSEEESIAPDEEDEILPDKNYIEHLVSADLNPDTALKKGVIPVVLQIDGEAKEGNLAVIYNLAGKQVYFSLSSLCKLMDLEYDLNPQYAEVVAGERSFDFTMDSCEVAFVGFTLEPVYDLAEPALFEQKDGKTKDVWILPDGLIELIKQKGMILEEKAEEEMPSEKRLLLYPQEQDEKDIQAWLYQKMPGLNCSELDFSDLRKMIVFHQEVRYDEYLKDVLIPEKGMASEPSQLGILSADIRDYNADGVDDLLVLELVETGFDGTFMQLLEEVEYGEGTPGRKCLAVKACFYTLVNNTIAPTDDYLVQMISEPYTGKIKIHLVQMDGTWYLTASSGWEDWTTVGDNFYRTSMILTVDPEGKFEVESVYGTVSFGQHGALAQPEAVGLGKGLDFTDNLVHYGMTSSSVESKTLLLQMEILKYRDSITFTDHTSLKQALDEGFDAVEPVSGIIDAEYEAYLEQQKQNESEEERRIAEFLEKYGTQVDSIRSFMTANAGSSLAKDEMTIYFPTDHRVVLALTFASEVDARFFFEEETGELLSVYAEGVGKNASKQDFNQVKDAVFMCPDLPFDAYQQYLGNVNSVNDEVSIPGWRLSVVQIDRWVCHIDRLSN